MPYNVVGLRFSGPNNSTFFTTCCGVAVIDETNCPLCDKKVIGWDIKDRHQRHIYRWQVTYTGGQP